MRVSSKRVSSTGERAKGDPNRLEAGDRPAHEWYRFVLSFPPHLVRQYLDRFGLNEDSTVLDPFSGTGTTVVEAKKQGVRSVGVEANPLAHFACSTKVDWTGRPDVVLTEAERIATVVTRQLRKDGVPDEAPSLFEPRSGGVREGVELLGLDAEALPLLLANSISARPLHKVLRLLRAIDESSDPLFQRYARLALATTAVHDASNLHFGPEVGLGTIVEDAAVVGPWLERMERLASDLGDLSAKAGVSAVVHHADSRSASQLVGRRTIDAVITSPPYPNEKDYTRTTRLESVILGFIRSKSELRALKKGLVRSNTRSVYVEDKDDEWIAGHPEVQRVAAAIEARRIELGKTSGFERMYHRVTKLYFGGMARHLADLRDVLRPGARLAYVVGDQASYLRVMIRTGEILADIAKGLGYEVEGIDLFRTRLATATKEQLREEVVVLRWPGRKE
jgi:hypothetical protein